MSMVVFGKRAKGPIAASIGVCLAHGPNQFIAMVRAKQPGEDKGKAGGQIDAKPVCRPGLQRAAFEDGVEQPGQGNLDHDDRHVPREPAIAGEAFHQRLDQMGASGERDLALLARGQTVKRPYEVLEKHRLAGVDLDKPVNGSQHA